MHISNHKTQQNEYGSQLYIGSMVDFFVFTSKSISSLEKYLDFNDGICIFFFSDALLVYI